MFASSEISAGNVPWDRLGIGNIGPFPLRPNECISIDVAFIVADSLNQIRTLRGNVDLMYYLADYVQDYFDTHFPDDGSDLLGIAPDPGTKFDESITAYPNPVRDIIHIKIPSHTPNFQANVQDLTGRTVLVDGVGNSEMDVSQLKAGVYFLNVKFENRTIIRKFVKL